MLRPKAVPLALLVLASASGCMTTGQLKELPLDTGSSRVFEAPLTQTLAAARQAMSEAEISVNSEEEVQSGSWMLIGDGPGATVRVVVQRTTDSETTVRVYSLVGDRELAFHYPAVIFESITSTLGGLFLQGGRQSPVSAFVTSGD